MSISGRSIRYIIQSVAFLAFIMALVSQTGLAQALPQSDTVLRQMFEAIQTGSYDQFLAQGDSKFRAGFTKQMFESLSRQLGPRLKRGYLSTSLGKLNQGGYMVYVWKIELKDGNDDLLVTLFFKDGKVGGFFAR